jgi:glycosyltransferase involved in cell wall biosynthesis
MTVALPRYAVVTPARDEAHNLPRLAACLAAQRHLPDAWVIVENGSSDQTRRVAEDFAAGHPWTTVLSTPGTDSPVRGAPIVRSLHAGFAVLEPMPEIVVSVDADVSFEPSFFEDLADRFSRDPRLGIAGGTCFEEVAGAWQQRFVTGSTVWGATRAYRSRCLRELLPLEERMGWDGLDEFKANALGWRTRTFLDLPFRHHRPEGERDGAGWKFRFAQGRASHYAGYRPWYLVLRALFQARRDPSALTLVPGYFSAVFRREPRCADRAIREYVREQQHPRNLVRRAREATGRGL